MTVPILCVSCDSPPSTVAAPKPGCREIDISKLCEPCWFRWAAIEPDEAEEEEVEADELYA